MRSVQWEQGKFVSSVPHDICADVSELKEAALTLLNLSTQWPLLSEWSARHTVGLPSPTLVRRLQRAAALGWGRPLTSVTDIMPSQMRHHWPMIVLAVLAICELQFNINYFKPAHSPRLRCTFFANGIAGDEGALDRLVQSTHTPRAKLRTLKNSAVSPEGSVFLLAPIGVCTDGGLLRCWYTFTVRILFESGWRGGL